MTHVMRRYVQLRFQADGSQIRQVLRRAVGSFSPDLTQDDAGTLELVLAEVLNNIVEHAYAGRSPGPVVLSLRRLDGGLTCQVEDQGLPMPGLRLPEGKMQPVADELRDLAEGGWGWALIRALTADLRYDRRQDVNHLSFRVPLASK